MKRTAHFLVFSLSLLPLGGRAFAGPDEHRERQEIRREERHENRREHREEKREERHEIRREEMRPRLAPPHGPVERFERRPGFVWSPGYHEWRDGRYVWTGGHYEAERSGYRWNPPRWELQNGVYVFVPGVWVGAAVEPAAPPPPPVVERVEGRASAGFRDTGIGPAAVTSGSRGAGAPGSRPPAPHAGVR